MQITFPDSYVSNCEWGEAQLRGKVRITWALSLNSIIVGNLAEKSSSSSLHGERLNLHVCIPHTCGLEHNLQRLLSGYRRDFTTVTPANCARDSSEWIKNRCQCSEFRLCLFFMVWKCRLHIIHASSTVRKMLKSSAIWSNARYNRSVCEEWRGQLVTNHLSSFPFEHILY